MASLHPVELGQHADTEAEGLSANAHPSLELLPAQASLCESSEASASCCPPSAHAHDCDSLADATSPAPGVDRQQLAFTPHLGTTG